MHHKVVICGIDTSSLPKCTARQMAELMQKVKQNKPQAREEFVMYNMRLVLSIVQRFTCKYGNSDDIFQVGVIGLLKAVDNFNIHLGVRFSTYAVPMIIGEIRRFLRDSTSIKVTRSMRDTAYKALQAREQIENAQIEDASLEQISESIHEPVAQIAEALDAISEPISIFDTVYHDGTDSLLVMDQLSDGNHSEEKWLERFTLKKAIKQLDPREKQILFLRYYLGKTQMEISEEIGISQAQVSRLEKNALEGCKRYCKE